MGMSEEQGSGNQTGEILVYEAPDGGARVEVIVRDETVWLSQAEMVDLFGRDRTVITRHIGNVFREGELPRKSNVQILHIASGGDRPTTLYSLDVIISVGYRVKSQRGTQFRMWATNTLRDHLIRGYTLNEKRLHGRGVEFEQAVTLLSSTLQNQHLITDQGQAVLDVVQRYARSWRILRDYDEDTLSHTPNQAGPQALGSPPSRASDRAHHSRQRTRSTHGCWRTQPTLPVRCRHRRRWSTSGRRWRQP